MLFVDKKEAIKQLQVYSNCLQFGHNIKQCKTFSSIIEINSLYSISSDIHFYDTWENENEFSVRFQKILELKSFIRFFYKSFHLSIGNVFYKITAYFQISNLDDLELEIINIKDIFLKSYFNDEAF